MQSVVNACLSYLPEHPPSPLPISLLVLLCKSGRFKLLLFFTSKDDLLIQHDALYLWTADSANLPKNHLVLVSLYCRFTMNSAKSPQDRRRITCFWPRIFFAAFWRDSIIRNSLRCDCLESLPHRRVQRVTAAAHELKLVTCHYKNF